MSSAWHHQQRTLPSSLATRPAASRVTGQPRVGTGERCAYLPRMATHLSIQRYTDGAAPPPLWAPPDPALAAAGVEGEYVVARVRLLAMSLLLIAPTWNI